MIGWVIGEARGEGPGMQGLAFLGWVALFRVWGVEEVVNASPVGVQKGKAASDEWRHKESFQIYVRSEKETRKVSIPKN